MGIVNIVAVTATVALAACFSPAFAAITPPTFTINSVADAVDANPGDGVCETAAGNHVCTLRAAVMEASYFSGAMVVIPDLGASYLLTHGELVINGNMTIAGAGPTKVVVDGNQLDRVLSVGNGLVVS